MSLEDHWLPGDTQGPCAEQKLGLCFRMGLTSAQWKAWLLLLLCLVPEELALPWGWHLMFQSKAGSGLS